MHAEHVFLFLHKQSESCFLFSVGASIISPARVELVLRFQERGKPVCLQSLSTSQPHVTDPTDQIEVFFLFNLSAKIRRNKKFQNQSRRSLVIPLLWSLTLKAVSLHSCVYSLVHTHTLACDEPLAGTGAQLLRWTHGEPVSKLAAFPSIQKSLPSTLWLLAFPKSLFGPAMAEIKHCCSWTCSLFLTYMGRTLSLGRNR